MARRASSGRLRSVSSGRSNLPRNHFIRPSTVLNSLGHTAYLTLFVTGTLQDTLRHLDTLASFDTKGHTSSAGHTGKHWRLKLCKAGPRLRPAHFEQNCQRLVKKIQHAARNWLRKKEISTTCRQRARYIIYAISSYKWISAFTQLDPTC